MKDIKAQVKKFLIVGCIVPTVFAMFNVKDTNKQQKQSEYKMDFTVEYDPYLEKEYKKELERKIKNPDMVK